MSSEITEETYKYSKQVEDLIENAEIEAELEAENQIRSKHTKLFMISAIGIGSLIFVYWGINSKPEEPQLPLWEEPQVVEESYVLPQPKPIPFPVNNNGMMGFASKEIQRPPQQNPEQTIQRQVTPVSLNREIQAPRPPATPAVMPKKVAPAKTKKSTLKSVPLPKTKSVPVLNEANPGKPGEVYIVQAGAFSVKRNAELLARKLKTKGLNAAIQTRPSQKLMSIVSAGAFEDEEASRESFQALKDAGFNPKLKKNGNGVYTFILGKFKTKSQAETLQDTLSVKGFLSSMNQLNVDTTNYVVQLGRFRTEDEARSTQKKMAELGFKKTFIKKTG